MRVCVYTRTCRGSGWKGRCYHYLEHHFHGTSGGDPPLYEIKFDKNMKKSKSKNGKTHRPNLGPSTGTLFKVGEEFFIKSKTFTEVSKVVKIEGGVYYLQNRLAFNDFLEAVNSDIQYEIYQMSSDSGRQAFLNWKVKDSLRKLTQAVNKFNLSLEDITLVNKKLAKVIEIYENQSEK